MRYILIVLFGFSLFIKGSTAQNFVNCENCTIVILNSKKSDKLKESDSWFQCKLNDTLNIVYYDSSKHNLNYTYFDSLDLIQKSFVIQEYYKNIIANNYNYNILNYEIIFFKLMGYIPSIICSQEDSNMINIFFEIIYNKLYLADETIPYTLAKMFICNPVFVSNEIKNQGNKKHLIIEELYVLDELLETYEKTNKVLVHKIYNELISLPHQHPTLPHD